MPKYQKHIDRKNKLQQIKFTLSTKIKFSWSYFKKLIAMNTLFDKYVIDYVKLQLDSGVKEILLYHSGDFSIYDNKLPELFVKFCETYHHDNIYYSDKVYEAIWESIQLYFSKYDDIRVFEKYDEAKESFYIIISKK